VKYEGDPLCRTDGSIVRRYLSLKTRLVLITRFIDSFQWPNFADIYRQTLATAIPLAPPGNPAA
jgi:hypothetical protein